MSDEGDIESAQRTLDAAEEARRDALRRRADSDFVDVLASLPGRRLVWSLMERAGIFTLSYAQEATHATAFNEGRRNEGLYLLARISALCPDRLEQMRRESLA